MTDFSGFLALFCKIQGKTLGFLTVFLLKNGKFGWQNVSKIDHFLVGWLVWGVII